MDPITISAIIAGVTALIGAGIGGAVTSKTNKENISMAERENAITREREDTAYQRKAADLKAAGINPIMAGLSGASGASASPGQIIPAQSSGSDISNVIAGLGANIPKGGKELAETDNIISENPGIIARASSDKIDSMIKELKYKFQSMTQSEIMEMEFGNSQDKWINMSAIEKSEFVQWKMNNAQLYIQKDLEKQIETNNELNQQIIELGGVELATKKIMLMMTEKDWEIIQATGADKAWERGQMISQLLTGLFNFSTSTIRMR